MKIISFPTLTLSVTIPFMAIVQSLMTFCFDLPFTEHSLPDCPTRMMVDPLFVT